MSIIITATVIVYWWLVSSGSLFIFSFSSYLVSILYTMSSCINMSVVAIVLSIMCVVDDAGYK